MPGFKHVTRKALRYLPYMVLKLLLCRPVKPPAAGRGGGGASLGGGIQQLLGHSMTANGRCVRKAVVPAILQLHCNSIVSCATAAAGVSANNRKPASLPMQLSAPRCSRANGGLRARHNSRSTGLYVITHARKVDKGFSILEVAGSLPLQPALVTGVHSGPGHVEQQHTACERGLDSPNAP